MTKTLNLKSISYRKAVIVTSLMCLIFLAGHKSVLAATAVVEINTGTNNINAVEGTLVIPAGIKVDKIVTGNSSVSFWVEEPKVNSGLVHFSGITPGGFQGKRTLFSISGSWNDSQLNLFKFENVRALLNDGVGKEAKVRIQVVTGEISEDLTPPESFTVEISSSLDMFNGDSFLVFSADDKGAGIDHYEVAYTWFFAPKDNDWNTAESPLHLTKENLNKKIYIKAVDKANNQKILVFKSDSYRTLFKEFVFFAIIVPVILFLILFKKWLKSTN